MKPLSRSEVQDKLANDPSVALVEVLDEEHYRKFHLPDAVNVPISADDFDIRIQEVVPEESRPVIVYCLDAECQASPKAAQRMENLGYTDVFDYEAGKEDWKAAGLPVEE